MIRRPIDYDKPVYCDECGCQIYDYVYFDEYRSFGPVCDECKDELSESEDDEWDRMTVGEYLEEEYESAYDAYCDRCTDEARDAELERRYG